MPENTYAIGGSGRFTQKFLVTWGFAILLGALLLACYWNSFHASWQYDDFINIVHNPKIHISQLDWSQFQKSITAGLDYQIISRPLAFLSFALNHKIGGLDVFGYHVVNFCIHWLAALFLFFFIRDTLKLPIFNGRYARQEVLIAALASAFWACHPIQVSAVTYIVQRMASMAGMFYIMAMYFYLKGRTAGRWATKFGFLSGCALCVLCALMTKENSVMVGFALLLYDLFFIQGVRTANLRRTLLWSLGITIAVGVVGALYMDIHWRHLLDSYDIRPFTPGERLLTQPRIIFLYLSLIAVPMTSRMGILHDIEISRSLWTPWTTAPAIAGLCLCIIGLVLLARRHPLFSFCGLFYFLNHAIESSFLNLELIYEHRNYIPSMLLFVPPAVAAVRSIAFFRYRRSFQWMVGSALILLLLSQSYTTFSYNRIYRSELSLWLHTAGLAPNLSPVHNNLGSVYWNLGMWDLANKEFVLARDLDRYNNAFHKGAIFYNLALYAAYREGRYEDAHSLLLVAKDLYAGSYKVWYQLGLMEVALGMPSAAHSTAEASLKVWPIHSGFYYLSSLALLKKHEYAQAERDAQRALDINPEHGGALMVMAQCNKHQGNYERAIEYWEHFLRLEPKNIYGITALIELYAMEHNYKAANGYLKRFDTLKDGQDASDVLEIAVKNGAISPYIPDVPKVEVLFEKLYLIP